MTWLRLFPNYNFFSGCLCSLSLKSTLASLPAAPAERSEVRDGGVVPDGVRAPAGAWAVGPAHRLPPGQVDVRDDGGALPNEEEDGAQ